MEHLSRLRRFLVRQRPVQRLVNRNISVPGLPRRRVQPGLVAAVTMVRNEADIIGHTVRHLLKQGVDLIIVVDNLSTDSTPRVLAELAAEDARVFVGRDTLDAYHQNRKMSRLAYLAHRAGADWVVLFDADEFWFSKDGRVADYLRAYPGESRVLGARLRDARPLSVEGVSLDDASASLRLDVDSYTEKVAIRPRGWVWVDHGNHTALDLGSTEPSELRIIHIPHRSYDQWRRKVSVGAASLENASLPWAIGNHWRDGAALPAGEEMSHWRRMVEDGDGTVVPLPSQWRSWADRERWDDWA